MFYTFSFCLFPVIPWSVTPVSLTLILYLPVNPPVSHTFHLVIMVCSLWLFLDLWSLLFLDIVCSLLCLPFWTVYSGFEFWPLPASDSISLLLNIVIVKIKLSICTNSALGVCIRVQLLVFLFCRGMTLSLIKCMVMLLQFLVFLYLLQLLLLFHCIRGFDDPQAVFLWEDCTSSSDMQVIES